MKKTQNNALAMKLSCKCVAVVRLQMIFSELLKSRMETSYRDGVCRWSDCKAGTRSLKQDLTEPVLTAHCWVKVLLALLDPAIMPLKHVGMFLLSF